MLKDEKENMMAKYYLAPMEGITTYIFRNAYHKYFRKMDKYYTPFFVPHSKRGLNLKEQEEILPEDAQELKKLFSVKTSLIRFILLWIHRCRLNWKN